MSWLLPRPLDSGRVALLSGSLGGVPEGCFRFLSAVPQSEVTGGVLPRMASDPFQEWLRSWVKILFLGLPLGLGVDLGTSVTLDAPAALPPVASRGLESTVLALTGG